MFRQTRDDPANGNIVSLCGLVSFCAPRYTVSRLTSSWFRKCLFYQFDNRSLRGRSDILARAGAYRS